MTNRRQSVDRTDWVQWKSDLEAIVTGTCSVNREAALSSMLTSACGIATRLLRRWGVRDAEHEAEDAAQRWALFMVERGFSRCDASRNMSGFAYRVLERECMAVLKSEAKWRARLRFEGNLDTLPRQVGADTPIVDFMDIDNAMSRLPDQYRAAVEQRLRGESPSTDDRAAYRQFHNRLGQARRQLREFLDESDRDFSNPRIPSRARQQDGRDWTK